MDAFGNERTRDWLEGQDQWIGVGACHKYTQDWLAWTVSGGD